MISKTSLQIPLPSGPLWLTSIKSLKSNDYMDKQCSRGLCLFYLTCQLAGLSSQLIMITLNHQTLEPRSLQAERNINHHSIMKQWYALYACFFIYSYALVLLYKSLKYIDNWNQFDCDRWNKHSMWTEFEFGDKTHKECDQNNRCFTIKLKKHWIWHIFIMHLHLFFIWIWKKSLQFESMNE